MCIRDRLYRSRNAAKNTKQKHILTSNSRAGDDSEFYRIEQRLAEQGWGRHTHETVRDWLARLKRDAGWDTAALHELVELHNRYRFDPLGLSEAQRVRLKASTVAWLAINSRGTPS
jgi:hypothetical protein